MLTAYSRQGLKPWEQLIIDTYPLIYLEPNPKIWDTNHPEFAIIEPRDRCNLRYGFEGVKPGWIGLVEKLSRTASDLVKGLRSSGIQPGARVSSCIIKEKLGSLHYQGNDNLIEPYHGLFFAYHCWINERSLHTCDRCGQPGQLRIIDRWLRVTLCDRHYDRIFKTQTRL